MCIGYLGVEKNYCYKKDFCGIFFDLFLFYNVLINFYVMCNLCFWDWDLLVDVKCSII